MVALYDYNPKENSPNANSKDELTFRAGDKIHVYGDLHPDGFYDGELENGSKGLVPSNYLKEVTATEASPEPALKTENQVGSSSFVPRSVVVMVHMISVPLETILSSVSMPLL